PSIMASAYVSFHFVFFFHSAAATQIYTLSPTRRSSDLVERLASQLRRERLRRGEVGHVHLQGLRSDLFQVAVAHGAYDAPAVLRDRKSTRLNSSHLGISYAVLCLKKKTTESATARSRSY